MDVGLDGNISNRSFDSLGNLAAHSWFKTLWEFCAHYSVDFSFSRDIDIPLLREDDCAIMECLINSGMFSIRQFMVLYRVRKFKKVHGKSIRPSMMTPTEGFSKHIYSREQPTQKDIVLWQSALRAITSPTLTRSPSLGKFCGQHPSHDHWFLSQDKTIVYKEISDGFT